jgi:carboxypeptidase C (cathepsin A)
MKEFIKGAYRLVFITVACLPGLAVMPVGLTAGQVSQPAGLAGMDLPDDSPITTQHQISIGNTTLKYTARAGFLTLRTDFREPKARIFYVSYTSDRGNDRTPRPLTFAWNGGPGSPASTLHLGMLGPRRGKTTDEYRTEPPPYELTDNSDTWLTFTDLVLVDPVGTGYSYTTRPEYLKEFWSTIGDTDSIAEFIRLYQVHYNANDAPLFIAGESYGTTRAAGVAKTLTDRRIPLSGVILLSGGNVGGRGNSPDLAPVLLLPSLTASAFFYKKLPADLQADLQSTLRKVETWAENEYSVALMKGDRLKSEERQSVIDQLTRFTGLDPAVIAKANLRINADMFARGLFREQNLELGHYGANLNWKMNNPNSPYDLWEDPSLVSNGVNALIVPYLRSELGFSVDARYAGPWGGGWPSPGTPRGDWTGQNWDRNGANANVNISGGLADAMRRNPTLRVFVIHGYYDLVAPYFSGQYFVSHMGLDTTLRRNVVFANYPGGHTMYSERATLHQMSADIGEFIKNTKPAKRPTPSVQQ